MGKEMIQKAVDQARVDSDFYMAELLDMPEEQFQLICDLVYKYGGYVSALNTMVHAAAAERRRRTRQESVSQEVAAVWLDAPDT